MNRPPRDYTAYGLHVRSPVALPFTPLPNSPHGEPDVTIRIGKTPEALHLPIWRSRRRETAPGALLLSVDGVARYLVTSGRNVVVEPRGGSDNDPGVFLTLVFAALLQQRGVLTLHASAVETGTGAVLFAGESGSGKSTLLAALVERGYAMLSDDLTGVVLAEGGRPTALSAAPGIRLWADALDALGWRPRAHGRVREGLEKYLAPAARFRSAPQAVRAIYLLEPWGRQDIAMEPVPVGGGAFKALLWRATYRRTLVRQMKVQPGYFRTVTAVARRVPVFRVMRPAHPLQPAALADRIEEDLQQARLLRGERPRGGTCGAPAGFRSGLRFRGPPTAHPSSGSPPVPSPATPGCGRC